jgi:hypothetical protein
MNKRFKKIINAALATIMTVGIVTVGSISAFAADQDFGFTTSTVGTTTTYDFTGSKASTAWNKGDTSIGLVAYTGSCLAPKVGSLQFDLSKTETADDNSKIYPSMLVPVSDSASSATVTFTLASYSSSRKLVVGTTNISPNNVSACTATVSSSNFTTYNDNKYIYIGLDSTASSNPNFLTLTVAETVSGANNYKLTGSCSNLSVGDKFQVGDFEVTVTEDGTWALTTSATSSPFTTGEYTITPPNGYEVSPSTVNVTPSDDGLTYTATESLTFTNVMSTISGSVNSTLAADNDTIIFFDSDNKYTATIKNGAYTCNAPAGTYSIALKSTTLAEAKLYINEPSVTVAKGASVTKNIEPTAITTEWDFTDKVNYYDAEQSLYKVEGKEGTIKGIKINATGTTDNKGKFQVQPSNSRVQINDNTTFSVPVTATQLPIISVSSGSISYTGTTNGYATFEVTKDNTYITKITLAEVNTATAGKAAYLKNGDSEYAIIIVPSTAAVGDKITLASGDESIVGPETIYSNVKISNIEYGATAFGGSESDYVYGYTVTGDNAKTNVATVVVTVE